MVEEKLRKNWNRAFRIPANFSHGVRKVLFTLGELLPFRRACENFAPSAKSSWWFLKNSSSRSSNANFHRVCELKVHPANQVCRPLFRTPTLRNFSTLRKFHCAKIPLCENSTVRKIRFAKFHFAKVPLRNSRVKKFFYNIHPNFIFHFSSLFRTLLRNFCMTVKNLP